MNRNITGFDFIFRLAVLLTATVLAVFFFLAGAKTALAASVKPVSMIEGDLLTAGHVFEGLPAEKATRVLGQAPQPGEDLILNTHTLLRIAVALDLPWRPVTANEQVVLRRAATVIDQNMIASLIRQELEGHGVEGTFEIGFTSGKPQIILPQDQPRKAELIEFDYNPQYDRFTAVLAAPSSKKPLSRLTVTGTTERIVSVPVLQSDLKNGDVIGSGDLTWIDTYAKNIQHDMVLHAEDMIGLTPRRMAMAGKPLRSRDLQAPRLVERGDKVTIILQNEQMYLTTEGKALQNGAKGDTVRVVNTGSNRSIDALVSGSRTVTVMQ